MTNASKVRAAQTRAKKLIEKQNKLGWEVKQSIIDRSNMEIPNNISAKKAQAIIDNLSAQTIKTLRTMKDVVFMEETTPIVTGEYKSGAKKYDVIHMDEPNVIKKEIEISDRTLASKVLEQIKFVMNNAPNANVAEEIETKLWQIELHGSKIFEEENREKRRAALVENLPNEKELKASLKKAEESGFRASEALMSLYHDLVTAFGTTEKGIAAYRMRQFQQALESVGAEYSSDPEERQHAADVLHWLIENDALWQSYRKQFKLKKIYHQTYDSNDLLNDVSDSIVDNPKYKIQILQYLVHLMSIGTSPWDILDKIDQYVEELKAEQE